MRARLTVAILLLSSEAIAAAPDRDSILARNRGRKESAALQFGPALNLSVEGNPFSVAISDFNLDGHYDIAVANYASNDVSILLGNGDGTFQSAVDYPSGNNPFSVRVGDFNRDGKPDLAVANGPLSSLTGSVTILLGRGDGTFEPTVQYPTQGGSTSLVIADFNGDRKLDLATTSYIGEVGVLLGNGDGTFQTAVGYAAGMNPYFVAVGDFNKDGNIDLVVANEGANDVSVLLGNGDGTFRAPVNYDVGANPHGVAVGDFNGDGWQDLVAVNLTTDNVSILLGNGDGTFRSAMNYGVGPWPVFVAVEDLNGDGELDLIVADSSSDEVSVMLGNGDGTFQPASDYNVQNNPRPIAIADLNGDGRADMVVANQGSNTISVLIGSAQNPPTQPLIVSVEDAESKQKSVVPGEWVSIYGTNLANATRPWSTTDFSGLGLPTNLSGVSVEFNGTPAAVAFISPTQLNAQVPAVALGPVAINVINNGVAGGNFSATVVPNAPSIFNYAAGTLWYAAAIHADGTLVGDPAVLGKTRKAVPGETIALFVNALAASPVGSLITEAIPYSDPLVLTIGESQVVVTFAGLTAPGQYQLNIPVPPDLAAGNYPISVSTAGQTSPPDVILPIGP